MSTNINVSWSTTSWRKKATSCFAGRGLAKTATEWFSSLPEDQQSSWAQLQSTLRAHYATHNKDVELANRITHMTQDDGATVSAYATEFEHCLSDFMQAQLFFSGLSAHTRTHISSLRPRTLQNAVRLAVSIPTADDNKSESDGEKTNWQLRRVSTTHTAADTHGLTHADDGRSSAKSKTAAGAANEAEGFLVSLQIPATGTMIMTGSRSRPGWEL